MGIDLAALGNAVLASIIFTAIGVIFFGLTIWVLAKVLPFSLRKEIEDDQNIALGVMIGIQEAARQMMAQGTGGKIINTASIAGKQGYEPLAHYCASKFGVVALTQAAARAFGARQITANCICPGVVATEMWKVIDKGFKDEGLTSRDNEAFETFSAGILLGRPSTADDLVGVARFLASGASDYMTGQSLVVDGGMVFV